MIVSIERKISERSEECRLSCGSCAHYFTGTPRSACPRCGRKDLVNHGTPAMVDARQRRAERYFDNMPSKDEALRILGRSVAVAVTP